MENEGRYKMIGEKRVFNYPEHFNSLHEYSAHRGQVVTVIRELDSIENNNPELIMYEIKASDGWIGQADEYELREGTK